jgi:hypothetical protein
MCADMLRAVGTVSCTALRVSLHMQDHKSFFLTESADVLLRDMITFLVGNTMQYTVDETGEKEYRLN